MRNGFQDNYTAIDAVNNAAKMIPATIAVFCSASLIYMWILNFQSGMHWSLFAITQFASVRISAHVRKQKLLGYIDTYLSYLIPQLIVVFLLLFVAV